MGRILHLFANYKWTGPADPAIRCAARLRQQGEDVVFGQSGWTLPQAEHRMAKELWRWRLPVWAGLELRKHFHLGSVWRDVRRLRRRLRRDPVAIVHAHLLSDHLIAALAIRKVHPRPLLVRSLYDPDPPRSDWRSRLAFASTDGVVAPTPDVAEAMRQRLGCDPQRVLYQEPVVEPPVVLGRSYRAQLGVRDEHFLVGITARIQPHRRFELLWETASLMAQSHPNVRWVLLGRGNERDTRALVEEPVARLGLQDRVILPGYLYEPAYSAALAALDAFVFLVPGSDGTCRAVREAMARGLPVVSTARGILPHLVGAAWDDAGAPGVCVDETPPAFARALGTLHDDPVVRHGRASAALQRARGPMDPVGATRRLRAFYQSLGDEAAR